MAEFSLHKALKVDGSLYAKVFNFIQKLVQDPTLPGLHIEPVQNCRDPRVRTGRVNDQYRAVMFELTAKGKQHFVLVDVLNHDDAYVKAERIRLEINPINGITQLIEETVPPRDVVKRPKVIAKPKKFTPGEVLRNAGITPEALQNELGVTPATANHVFELGHEDDIETEFALSPAWERDALTGLLAGYTINEVRDSLSIETGVGAGDTQGDTERDDERIIEGLQHPAAALEFKYDANQEDLEAIISQGDFNAWRIFVHPEQQHVINANYSGSARVTGGAGTGKTVVTLHRANRLAADGRKRVLLTTYTRSLADSLTSHMNVLNPEYTAASKPGAPGLWISGIDALIAHIIKHASAEAIRDANEAVLGSPETYRLQALDNQTEQQLWEECLGFVETKLSPELTHPTFLAQEYEAVVLANGIKDQKEYLKVPRPGRGTPLSRTARKDMWNIISAFRRKCSTLGRATFPTLAAIAAHILERRATISNTNPDGLVTQVGAAPEQQRLFDHVLIDEAQDFHAGHWKFLRACVAPGPNDIFLAEDAHQRIYGQRLTLSHFGISTLGGASRKLTLNYRTTKETLEYAVRILEGQQWISSTNEEDSITGYRSARSGPEPLIVEVTNLNQEIAAAANQIKHWTAENPNAHIGILTRSTYAIKQIIAGLEEHELQGSTTRKTQTTDNTPISVMTMHNAKGLEFTHVILMGINAKSVPQRHQLQGLGEAETADQILRERALLYVAASRARDALMVTVSGERSELMPKVNSKNSI
ncbi:3'-5' exonuclease [Corynebacterium freiburgense]|uniref:3'-5' exonuclease n=1 Tax=Corynebacterium freiburgense TaxID=556548 RepID=UPI00041998E1|nr:3'-5' exonuclease [Corynebacterium freiburgense]WJZ03246.1 Helicase IV [Corynebacterium freiburgense]